MISVKAPIVLFIDLTSYYTPTESRFVLSAVHKHEPAGEGVNESAGEWVMA
jgi:hypothetical protein